MEPYESRAETDKIVQIHYSFKFNGTTWAYQSFTLLLFSISSKIWGWLKWKHLSLHFIHKLINFESSLYNRQLYKYSLLIQWNGMIKLLCIDTSMDHEYFQSILNTCRPIVKFKIRCHNARSELYKGSAILSARVVEFSAFERWEHIHQFRSFIIRKNSTQCTVVLTVELRSCNKYIFYE